MDAFFVSVERIINPRLVGKPVIVGGRPDRRGVVAAASYEARAFGVHSAMAMAAAVKRCPQAIRLDGHHHLYADYSAKIMAILERFTPAVYPVSVDEAYLDLTGCERIHKAGPVTVAERIHDTIRQETGLPCSIGVAGNRVTAKIASVRAKPDGLLAILPGYDAAFMAPLPIGAMPGIGPAAECEYKKMGIEKIGDLLRFSSAQLERVFGKGGERAARRARGECPPPTHAGPPRSIGKEVTYAVDSHDPAYLEATLSYLSERVAQRMKRAGVSFRRVTVKIRYADFNTATRSRVLVAPAAEAARIFAVARKLLRTLTASRRIGVRLVGVSISLLTNQAPQLSLFESRRSLAAEALDNSVEAARKKFGFGAVMTARSLLYAADRRRSG
jgi:DNA polymerase-4